MFKMDYYVPKITISGQKMIVKVTEKWYKKIFLKFLHAKPFFGPTDLKFVYSEGHKILRNLHLTFDCMYCSQKKVEDFAKFLTFSEYINFINQRNLKFWADVAD